MIGSSHPPSIHICRLIYFCPFPTVLTGFNKVSVVVILSDVNDNPPRFVFPQDSAGDPNALNKYYGAIAHDAPAFTLVQRVNVSWSTC